MTGGVTPPGPSGTALVGAAVIAAVLVVSRALARRSRVPRPVFLLVAGAAVSFLPGMPTIRLDPQVVFLGFLPPLVYHAGFLTSPRELRANAVPIGLGALGLVLVTTFAVAGAVFGAVPTVGWDAAFILGAIVAPTDPVAASAVLNRLGAPASIVTILEGESLVNDGIALSLLTIGIAGLTSTITVPGGMADFARVALGGTAFGLAVGWLAARLRRYVHEASSDLIVSLVLPFVAYLPADALGLSGVLSALVAGLIAGQQGTSRLAPSGRISVVEFWRVLAFLLESVLFVLVGLQLRSVAAATASYPLHDVVLVATLSVVSVIGVRLCWWLAVPTLRVRPEGRFVDTGGVPWQERVALGWSGLRGAISLAAALSIPIGAGNHAAAKRGLLVLAAFCVIAVTLLGQATTLPFLLRRLNLVGDETEQHQRMLAERRLAEAALHELDRIGDEDEVAESELAALRELYEQRLGRIHAELNEDEPSLPEQTMAMVQHRLLATQHQVLRALHEEGAISFAVMRDLSRRLDLEQASLEP